MGWELDPIHIVRGMPDELPDPKANAQRYRLWGFIAVVGLAVTLFVVAYVARQGGLGQAAIAIFLVCCGTFLRGTLDMRERWWLKEMVERQQLQMFAVAKQVVRAEDLHKAKGQNLDEEEDPARQGRRRVHDDDVRS